MGKKQLDDEVLIQRISDKDVVAFKRLVDLYQASVYNTCLSIIGDHHQAEEAAQDTFYQIFRSAGSFRGESKASTWIYRIAVTRSLNLIHKNKRFRWVKSLSSMWHEDINEGEISFATSSDEPGNLLEKKEEKGLLKSAVDSLPEKQRVAFVLSKYEDLTSREISEVLGISVNSVEARIHRAKLRLQRRLVSVLKKNSERP
ncbi:RNA polymerase sigma factor [Acidobacteriota bacterium]